MFLNMLKYEVCRFATLCKHSSHHDESILVGMLAFPLVDTTGSLSKSQLTFFGTIFPLQWGWKRNTLYMLNTNTLCLLFKLNRAQILWLFFGCGRIWPSFHAIRIKNTFYLLIKRGSWLIFSLKIQTTYI